MSEERERFSATVRAAYAAGQVCLMHSNAGWTACDCPKLAGHNNPPSQAEFASTTALEIGQWLKEHPVIQTEEEAKAYKLLRDRGKCCLADMEDERKAALRPLQMQVNAVNNNYVGPRVLLEKTLDEGDNRVDAWMRQEEERRRKIKEEAWEKVAQRAKELEEAEAREQEAVSEARLGVETDILAASRDADAGKRALEHAERAAMRAERNKGVKITGGHRRALSARYKVEFIITDPILTVKDVGWSERLLAALESDVRQYYQKFSTVPKGVQIKSERKVQ